MLSRLYAQLPEFARPNHPVMRYMLLREGRRVTARGRFVRVLLGLLLLFLAVAGGWVIATRAGQQPLNVYNPLDTIYLVLYWPLVFMQLLLRIAAFNTTVGVIAGEVEHGTWETLKITTEGALLSLKARWAVAFYRLWTLLLILLVARVLFIGVALSTLSTAQGQYLDNILSGTVPFGAAPDVNPADPGSRRTVTDAPLVFGIGLVAMMMTAGLLAPFTSVAFDAALGMYIATFAKGRTLSLFWQVVVVILRIVLTGWALWVGAGALSLSRFSSAASSFDVGSTPLMGWLGALAGIAEGDLGLTLLYPSHYTHVWADYDYGVFVGIAGFLYVLGQAMLANMLVHWAGKRALNPSDK